MNPTLEMPSCPVCLGHSWRIDAMAERILGLVEPYHVQECRGCGQRRLVPQLGPGDLEKLYDRTYFAGTSATSESDAGWASPDCHYISQIVPERLAKFSQTLADLKRLFPDAKTFLDVGAATGDMVKLARDSGLASDGLEFSDFAVRQARERLAVELMQLPLARLDAPARYDLIHLNHVFEHFNDPVAELKHLRRLLKPGGGLYIEVPMQFQFVERVRMRLKPTHPELSLHSLHHPYFYTPATMRRILRDNGFDVVSVKVFEGARYPAHDAVARAKKWMWRLLSVFEVGIYIEVIATPTAERR